MNKWNEIIKKCPTIYKRKNFYFECGIGWFDIIHDLSLKLEEIAKTLPDKDITQVTQVKEKYGTLRFYMVGNDRMHKLIDEAEDLSKKMCEICGDTGTLRHRNNWYMMRCDKCLCD